jgi:uncharacterized protein YebE (UPF0316 family)
MSIIFNFLFIFFARVIDVSLLTVRTLLLVRGKKYIAAVLGFFEVTIYIVALGKVMSALDNWVNIMAYSLGFAAGNIVGSVIENKMAIGTIIVRIVPKKTCDEELAEKLRSMGFGVTMIEGIGKNGPVCMLDTTLHRKELPVLMDYLKKTDAEAFVTISDARETRGGYMRSVTRK